MNRKLRMGMVGGGTGAFIGAVHRLAALMDNQIELVCGCFSANPVLGNQSGLSYFLPESRIYKTYAEMFEKEVKLPEGERMDFVTIVTPNVVHFDPARLALENGFHVVIDKPVTFSSDEAKQLKKLVDETGLTLALTHVYSGYPTVKEARERITGGFYGKVRTVYVEYLQGWLSDKAEDKGNAQASWRTDPKRSGKAGCMGDIGTHALHLAEYITGLHVTEMCGQLDTFVPGRLLDDNGNALLRFEGGVSGVLSASQVAAGEENNLRIRIYCEKGGIEWAQQEPNTLIIKYLDRPAEIVRTGGGYMSPVAKHNTRTPGGHPEGYIEAFANIYRNFALTIRAKMNGQQPKKEWLDFPTIEDGVRGMQFIDTIVNTGYNQNKKWIQWMK